MIPKIVVVLMLVAMCMAQLPDTPQPQTCYEPSFTVGVHPKMVATTCKPRKTDWRVLPEKPGKSRHWVARHPLLTGGLIGGTTAFVIWKLTYHPCPKMINGYPYDGTAPCPNPKTYDPGPRR